MKKTETKYLVKVNQIFPIMQEHFGNSMNLVRIKPHKAHGFSCSMTCV